MFIEVTFDGVQMDTKQDQKVYFNIANLSSIADRGDLGAVLTTVVDGKLLNYLLKETYPQVTLKIQMALVKEY